MSNCWHNLSFFGCSYYTCHHVFFCCCLFVCLSHPSHIRTHKSTNRLKNQTYLKSILKDLIWLKVMRNSCTVPYLFLSSLNLLLIFSFCFLPMKYLQKWRGSSAAETIVKLFTVLSIMSSAQCKWYKLLWLKALLRGPNTGCASPLSHITTDHCNFRTVLRPSFGNL